MTESKKSNKKTNPKSNAGRKPIIDEILLAKLEEGFARGLTDNEACLYANINPSTLYRYIDKNPEFSKRKELLKDQPKMKAKLVVTDKINSNDDYNARWYLERKSKDEFSTKEIIDQTTKSVTYTSEEWEELTDEEIDKIINE